MVRLTMKEKILRYRCCQCQQQPFYYYRFKLGRDGTALSFAMKHCQLLIIVFLAGNITANNINKSQVDGACDSSDDEISEGGGSDEEAEGEAEGEEAGSVGGSEGGPDDDEAEGEGEGGAEEEPLNSGDDVSEEDPSDMFDTDNVVVCQYDKVT